jgi:hypothetical protein
MNFKIPLILITNILLMLSGCSQIELNSIWKSEDLNLSDWREFQTVLEDEEISIAAINNNDYLFLYLATFDRAKVMQMMHTGLTIWFTEDGEKVGIRYPIRQKRDKFNQDVVPNEREFDKMWGMFQEFIVHQNEFMVVNEDDFPLNAYPIHSPTGVKLNMEYQIGQLVYSLRIPLADLPESDFRLNSSAGETITLEFQTGEFNTPDRPGRGFGNRRPGGGRGNAQMPNRSGGFSKPEPIDFSINLVLAKN